MSLHALWAAIVGPCACLTTCWGKPQKRQNKETDSETAAEHHLLLLRLLDQTGRLRILQGHGDDRRNEGQRQATFEVPSDFHEPELGVSQHLAHGSPRFERKTLELLEVLELLRLEDLLETAAEGELVVLIRDEDEATIIHQQSSKLLEGVTEGRAELGHHLKVHQCNIHKLRHAGLGARLPLGEIDVEPILLACRLHLHADIVVDLADADVADDVDRQALLLVILLLRRLQVANQEGPRRLELGHRQIFFRPGVRQQLAHICGDEVLPLPVTRIQH
mmetsp:Transcript_138101/g.441234  ORF Transcript_138101/g.441234 Transcript_138101/m.441234 type:complete len:277 (-) Transcript_138101:436-1266(-)